MKNIYLLLPFPVALLGVALSLALIATYYFYQKKLSTWLFIGTIVVLLGVGSIGSYYLNISLKPDLSTEEVKYCREINDHLSFSTKYVFENENNQELTVTFPFLINKDHILSEPFVPNQKYDLTYETRAKVIIAIKKNAATKNASARINITKEYNDKEPHYSSINSILKLSILPFSIAAIILFAAILGCLESDRIKSRLVIISLSLVAITVFLYRGFYYVNVVNHPVIIAEETTLTSIRQDSATEGIELKFVDDDGNVLSFFPLRNTVENYLNVEELNYGRYRVVFEEKTSTLLDIIQLE